MSRYRGNADACPACGATYGALRTGLTFEGVLHMLWSGATDSREWRYKRRGTVLGLWHQIKQEEWHEHLRACDYLEEKMTKRRARG